MAALTKEHILREIRRVADENGGVPLGRERFEAQTGIREAAWLGRYWARWSDVVRDAGYEPSEWSVQVHDDDALTRFLADATRELGHFPTTAEKRLRRRAMPNFPNSEVFRNRLGDNMAQLQRLVAFADQNPEYADVATLCSPAIASKYRPQSSPEAATVDLPVTGVVYMIRMGDHFKVGRSNDLDRRTRELRTQLPVREELIHTIETDDPSGIEAYWHRRFAAHRANGEWFTLLPADVAAFKRRTYM